MPSASELSKRFLPYVDTLLNKTDWKPDPEVIVWHYTSGNGLIGIVESGTLYSTQVSCLNDATEIRYAASKLREALTALLPTLAADEPALAMVKKYIELMQDDDVAPNNVQLPFFVTCFSSIEDDLSQWRSYGGGENGYAVGFRVKDLFGVPNSFVTRVNYDAAKHTELAKDAAEATVRFYKEGIADGGENWDDVFIGAWDAALTQVAPVLKDPGFELEREIRLIHHLQQSDICDLRVLQRKTMMSRHFPVRFPNGGHSRHPRLPIHRVMVGPSRHKAISRVSVDTLLRTHGYFNVEVSLSGRPYQEM
jgi:Protein of unknown function (DUF2971)